MRKIAFDLETHPFSPNNMAPKPVCLTWAEGEQADIVLFPAARAWLGDWLEDPEVVLIAHNGAYDFTCLLAHYPELSEGIWNKLEAGLFHDTKSRERLLHIAQGIKKPCDLGTTMERRFGVVLDKEGGWRTNYDQLDGVPLNDWPREAVDYAVDDARATLMLYIAQDAEALDLAYSWEGEVCRQSSYRLPMNLMGTWGIRTNGERVKVLKKQVLEKIASQEGLVVEAGLGSFNKKGKLVKSMKAIRERVVRFFPEGSPPRTPKGAIQTAEGVLAQCNDPALQAVVEFAALQKLLGTYIEPMEQGVHQAIHANFDALGADSGRSSCSKPNLQNQPKLPGLRECFEARPGYVYAAADFDTQELRTLAQTLLDILGESRLAERYRADPDFDPHTLFASEMLRISYEDGLRQKAAGDAFFKEKRQQAKAVNFGLPGGLGAAALVGFAKGYGVELDLDEAAQLKAHWFSTWPEMDEYFKWINSVSQNGFGTLTLPRSGRRRGRILFTEAANGCFQGLASDASKTALWRVSRKCYTDPASALWSSRPVAFIHDEIIIEAPEDRAPEAALEMADLMMKAQEMWTPDIPARASAHLMRYWSKSAEPVHNKFGRLIPWEDR